MADKPVNENLVAPDPRLSTYDQSTQKHEGLLPPGRTVRLRLPGVNNYIEVKADRDRPGCLEIRSSSYDIIVLPRGCNCVTIGCPDDAN